LFDDVKINEILPIGKILQLTDWYPIQVPKKGGFITWKPKAASIRRRSCLTFSLLERYHRHTRRLSYILLLDDRRR
jgi:hypothetical protein